MSATEKKRGWWPRCRRVFRGVRICTWSVIFIVLVVLTYLNEVGLPNFVKQPLLRRLQAQGVDLQFSRLRLHGFYGLVADDVRFGHAGEATAGPQFRAREVQVKLNHIALLKLQVTVDSLILHDGRLVWPDAGTNSARPFAATNIQAQLRFLAHDQWKLDHFTAFVDGLRLQLAVSVTNATALRGWPIFRARPGAPPERTEEMLRQLTRIIDRLKFPEPPDLVVILDGDARNSESFHGLLTLNTPAADTPWGTLTNGTLLAQLTAAGTVTNQPQVDLELRAEQAATPWAGVRDLHLHLHAMAHEQLTNVIQANLEISADQPATEWARATKVRLKAEWTHSFTNMVPLSGVAELHLVDARSRWGNADAVDLNTRLNAPAGDSPRQADATWGWWAALEPYSLDWNCRLGDIHVEDERVGVFEFKELACGGDWRAPELTVTNAHAELYRGEVSGRARLNVATRELAFDGMSDFDAQKALPLLTEGGREWLKQFSWTDPPLGHASGTVVLPEWTNSRPDWRSEVLPTLFMHGDVQASESAFRGVPVSAATCHFIYSNMTWHLPDLVAERPEGRLELEIQNDDRTKRFYYHVHSTIDPKAARHLLPPEGQRGLDLLVLTRPPVIDCEIWGQWHDPDSVGAQASVTITNFALRGESAAFLSANLSYTNKYLIATDAQVEQGGGHMSASGIGVDLVAKEAHLTNGFSQGANLEPFVRVLGPKIYETMSPYHFGRPATVHASGTIPLAEGVPPDLHFTVDGGPFNWLRFNLDHVSGGIDWVDKRLSFTNFNGQFYSGHISGTAMFDFSTPHAGADFSLALQVVDADLHTLLRDLVLSTNHLEGRLTGNLDITRASTSDLHNWNGGGQVDLRNGLIWEIPIFGIFSPVLDSFQRGWGQSRVDRGDATYSITNSVIRSDNLLFRSSAVELQYRGTVDFSGRVDATVQAQLLRSMPLVGPLLSLALSPFTKLFEYKVSGTLSDPKSEPLYDVTKLLMLPVQTFRIIAPSQLSAPTNTPPATIAPPPPSPGP
jgi:hypothetical protein